MVVQPADPKKPYIYHVYGAFGSYLASYYVQAWAKLHIAQAPDVYYMRRYVADEDEISHAKNLITQKPAF